MASVGLLRPPAPCRTANCAHTSQRGPISPWLRHPAPLPRRTRRTQPARSSKDGAAGSKGTSGDQPEQLDAFDQECASAVIRVLTAKAVQKVLTHLQSADSFTAHWLNRYCAEHPPLDGNTFLAALMSERPLTQVDPYTGASADINPVQLAARIMATREELVKNATRLAPRQVASDNILVLRSHLEAHTYVSGSIDLRKPSYRSHRTTRGAKQQDHHLRL